MALQMLALGAAMLLIFQSPTLARTTTRASDTYLPSTTTWTSVCSNNGLTLSAVPGQVGCLTSPNYPSPYYNNADCRWLINAGSGYVVKVSVLNISLETCCDYLEIYDGTQEVSTSLITKIFFMPSQTVFYSSGQYMDIRFHSDYSVTFSGFRLTYEAISQQSVTSDLTTTTTTTSEPVCSDNETTLFAVEGQVRYLTIPVYQNDYYGLVDCSWIIDINSTSNYVVKATLLNATSDFHFYIAIRDGMSDLSSTLVWISSMPSQTVYYSSGQSMYIRLTTDGLGPNSSFSLTYEAVNPLPASTSGPATTTTFAATLECSTNGISLSAVPGQVGYLTSPHYPFYYDNNADCRWLINAGSGYVVKVSVTDISLETCCDFVSLYDGIQVFNRVITTINYMSSQRVFYSSGQYMYIRFYSDGSVTSSGFRLTYEVIDQQSVSTSVCSGTTLSAVAGRVDYLTSSNYSFADYSFINCSWTINSATGYVVKATLLNATSSSYFFIEIHDGMSESSPLLAWFSGMPSQTEYYSSGQSLYIRIVIYSFSSNSFFNLTYQAVDPWSVNTSDTMLTSATPATSVYSANASTLFAVPGQDGHLTSPNYPSPYYNNANCGWLINAGSGYVVKVSVTDVSLETCCDYFEIYDGALETNTTPITRMYSMPSQPVLYSSGQYMYIRFYSDGSVTYSGFRLKYEAVKQQSVPPVCPVNGTTLSALPGQVYYLRFPIQPSNYSNNTDCRWVITSTSGYVVKVTVLDASSDIFDHIEIFDGMSESSPTLVTFYGMPPQTVYYSSGQYMYIRFTGYGSVTNSVLRVTYEAVNQPSVPTPGPTIPTTAPRTSDPCTCTCSCVSTCSHP